MENIYFSLDLKLPNHIFDKQVCSQRKSTILKFNLAEKLISIFGRNPRDSWFRSKLKPKWKYVRFSTTEIDNTLPHCRRYGNYIIGHLHSPECPNSQYESPDILGDNAWQNRVFILSCSKQIVSTDSI